MHNCSRALALAANLSLGLDINDLPRSEDEKSDSGAPPARHSVYGSVVVIFILPL